MRHTDPKIKHRSTIAYGPNFFKRVLIEVTAGECCSLFVEFLGICEADFSDETVLPVAAHQSRHLNPILKEDFIGVIKSFGDKISINCDASSEFVSSSIPSWQILTAHAKPFRGSSDMAFCLKVPLDSLLVWSSSGGSGETARMRRLAWTFAARIGDKY